MMGEESDEILHRKNIKKKKKPSELWKYHTCGGALPRSGTYLDRRTSRIGKGRACTVTSGDGLIPSASGMPQT